MSDYQENVISMFFKIKLFIAVYLSALVVKAPALTTLVQTFLDQMGLLEDYLMENSEVLTGVAIMKQNNRSAMRDKTLLVANGLVAMHLTNKRPDLANKARLTKSDIDGLRDVPAFIKCSKIGKMVKVFDPALIPFGVTADMCGEAATATEAYSGYLAMPASERAESKAYNTEIVKLFPLIMGTLEIFDNIIGTLREAFSLECSIYDGHRSIDNNSGPGTPPDVDRAIPPLTIDPVINIPYLIGRQFKITNEDPDNSILYGISTLNNAFTHPHWVLGPGKSTKVLSMTLGPDGDFLLIQNLTTLPMNVKVWIIE